MNGFPVYSSRRIMVLDGIWDFCWGGNDIEWNAVDIVALNYSETTVVPGIFELSPDRYGQRGVGFYRKKIMLFGGSKRLKIKLGALGLQGKIWWDGKLIGENVLPYSGLEYELPALTLGEHELVIAVDNRLHNYLTDIFMSSYDFYGFGGIYRSIELHELSSYSIDRVRVTPLDISRGRVRLDIMLEGKLPSSCEYTVGFDGGGPENYTGSIMDGKITLELDVPGFKLWSPESPNLHTVEIMLNGDRICERFGLREISVSNGNILLNGKPLKLCGFNRHESHPQSGPVQSWQFMLDDLKLLKQLNCNFIRGAHYPMDQRFLDLCDQLGFLVWEESMGWGNKAEQMADPEFIRRQQEQTRRMVHNSYNHPSIIIWGFMNEGESNKENAVPLYRDLSGILRDNGGQRLISYASNRWENDCCFEYADIISMNIYPGWIGGSSGKSWGNIAPFVDKLAHFADRNDLRDKPFIISEIGACALYGCHDLIAAQWSEEFQRDYMSEAVRAIMSHPRYCGICLWQMFDSRSYGDEKGANIRCKPRGYNCAGVFDEFRRPKLAAAAIADLYKKLNFSNGEVA